MFRRQMLSVVLICGLSYGCGGPMLLAAEPEFAKLVIDYGDGAERHFPKLAWQEKQTVLDLLAIAVKHPRGIKVATQGKGELTMVIAIDELKEPRTR